MIPPHLSKPDTDHIRSINVVIRHYWVVTDSFGPLARIRAGPLPKQSRAAAMQPPIDRGLRRGRCLRRDVRCPNRCTWPRTKLHIHRSYVVAASLRKSVDEQTT